MGACGSGIGGVASGPCRTFLKSGCHFSLNTWHCSFVSGGRTQVRRLFGLGDKSRLFWGLGSCQCRGLGARAGLHRPLEMLQLSETRLLDLTSSGVRARGEERWTVVSDEQGRPQASLGICVSARAGAWTSACPSRVGLKPRCFLREGALMGGSSTAELAVSDEPLK